MSHARRRASALSTLTLAFAVSLPALAADPPATAPATAPAAPTAQPPAAAATPAPAAPTPASDAAPADATAPKGDDADAKDDEESDGAPAKDSDASPAAPPTKPSPALLFLQSRRQATPHPEAPPVPDDGLMGTHQEHFHVGVGVRVSFVPNEGYDLFSEDNDLTQLSFSAGRTVFAAGDLSFDASALWDWGPSASTARGAETTLNANRVSLGLEGRYHLLRRLYLFGRLAPGALRWDASIEDGGADVRREAGNWMFSADAGGGAAFEFAGENRGKSKQARGFVLVDGGYGWTTSSALDFVPADGARPPARLQPLDLGELALRGGYFRLAAALTY